MTDTLAERAADFIAATGTRRHAPDVIDQAKRCLVDWMGVAIGASGEPVSRTVVQSALAWGATGKARILIGEQTTPALAALANATMGHALDFDDTRGHAPSHLSSPSWAATLAVAEHRGLDGAAALGAFIAGYEISAVLGDVMVGDVMGGENGFGNLMQGAGFHPTGVFGRLSAAAATAVLMGCDRDQIVNALATAATMGGGLTASFGTMAKPLHSGKAAMDGVHAAELAARGFVAARDVFEAPGGFANAFVQTATAQFDDVAFSPGESLFDNSFKPYACGKLIHGHIDAARDLRDGWAGRPVAQIRCRVAEISTRLVGRPLPTTHLEGKFSVAFCIALALNGYPVLPGDFSAERLADPKVQDIMGKVELSPDSTVGRYGSVLEIELTDGEVLRATVERSRGNPENPLSWIDLKTKFDGMVEPVLGDRTGALYDALRVIDEPGGLPEIQRLIQPLD
ncbi:MAG: MmgE/PrpD family protein [Rhodospirillaceae bacterium]|nr:MmgE/PrpD family protein [Rhodospirillaceae bacterium]